MILANDRYTYRVQWSDEDEEYVGLCAEFPSLSWLAATPEDAMSGILSVVGAVLIDLASEEE
jgi:predicted RNase H-like HicB family nuclease